MRIALATVGTTGDMAEAILAAASDQPMREAARDLAARIAEEDGLGASIGLLEEAAS
jgi:UDP:flavonoid glycosyltransferase YjiC (YdhE family)